MLPQASAAFRAADLRAVGRRGDLHLAGGAGAGGHEEADRLFVGRPYGRGDDRHLHLQRAGHRRARCSRCCRTASSPARCSSCVGVVYDRIHTREIARYGGLADRMPAYALVFMVFTMATHRPARHVRLRRRVPGHRRRVPGELLAGAARRHRHDPGRGLHAVSLPPRDLRQDHAAPICAPSSTCRRARCAVFAPLVVLTLWMGIYPSSFTSFFDASVGAMVQITTRPRSPRHASQLRRRQAALHELDARPPRDRPRLRRPWRSCCSACCASSDSTFLCTMLTLGALAARRRCWCIAAPMRHRLSTASSSSMRSRAS